MSRSTRKRSIAGVTAAASDKRDKQKANRTLRRLTRVRLQAGGGDAALPVKREVIDPWAMRKEGKLHFDAAGSPKRMRK